jgi:4-hydroxybenzoate polyprenyltransferase
MAEIQESKLRALFGKTGATIIATATTALTLACNTQEGLDKLDSIITRWVLCAILAGIGVVYLAKRNYERDTGILLPDGTSAKLPTSRFKFAMLVVTLIRSC